MGDALNHFIVGQSRPEMPAVVRIVTDALDAVVQRPICGMMKSKAWTSSTAVPNISSSGAHGQIVLFGVQRQCPIALEMAEVERLRVIAGGKHLRALWLSGRRRRRRGRRCWIITGRRRGEGSARGRRPYFSRCISQFALRKAIQNRAATPSIAQPMPGVVAHNHVTPVSSKRKATRNKVAATASARNSFC